MLCFRLPVKLRGVADVPHAFDCGKCGYCLMKQQSLKVSAIRLEARYHRYGDEVPYGCFLTLTFADKYLPIMDGKRATDVGAGRLSKREVQLFLKRLDQRLFPRLERKQETARLLRERLGVKASTRVRYACVGEYGDNGTLRPHYHLILFGLPSCARLAEGGDVKCRCEVCNFYRELWSRGDVEVQPFAKGVAYYVSEYISKSMLREGDARLGGRPPEFFLSSRRPALGDLAVREHAQELLDDEAAGVEVEDFDRWIYDEVDGKALMFSKRQVQNGRRAMGRDHLLPMAAQIRLAAKDADIRAIAMKRPVSERAEVFRALAKEKYASERLKALERWNAKLERKRKRLGVAEREP